MSFSIETESHAGAHNGFVRVYVRRGETRTAIADVYEKPDTDEIRLNLPDGLADLAEAKYTRLPLFDGKLAVA